MDAYIFYTQIRLSFLFSFLIIISLSAQIEKTYSLPMVKQGVAVNDQFFYVINNSEIVTYTKDEGKLVNRWKDTTRTIKHLNSGIILNNKLYCTNSNYPEDPMVSSIEVFDPQTLQHIANISFGIYIGSATWVDFYKDHWYVAFAHYTGKGSSENKNNHWTQLVKFTKDWQRVEGWIFPEELINKFDTRSNSGGFITNEGVIYVTGHDNKELYELYFPKMSYTLEWKQTYPIPFEGQGIALDKTEKDFTIFGIIRSENKVVKSVIKR